MKEIESAAVGLAELQEEQIRILQTGGDQLDGALADSVEAQKASADAGEEIKEAVINGTQAHKNRTTAIATGVGAAIGTVASGLNAIGGILGAGVAGVTTHFVGKKIVNRQKKQVGRVEFERPEVQKPQNEENGEII